MSCTVMCIITVCCYCGSAEVELHAGVQAHVMSLLYFLLFSPSAHLSFILSSVNIELYYTYLRFIIITTSQSFIFSHSFFLIHSLTFFLSVPLTSVVWLSHPSSFSLTVQLVSLPVYSVFLAGS